MINNNIKEFSKNIEILCCSNIQNKLYETYLFCNNNPEYNFNFESYREGESNKNFILKLIIKKEEHIIGKAVICSYDLFRATSDEIVCRFLDLLNPLIIELNYNILQSKLKHKNEVKENKKVKI